jgi:hypothetical protein
LITVGVHVIARSDLVSGAFKLPLFKAYDIPEIISYYNYIIRPFRLFDI